jgi:hypothetical protein
LSAEALVGETHIAVETPAASHNAISEAHDTAAEPVLVDDFHIGTHI